MRKLHKEQKLKHGLGTLKTLMGILLPFELARFFFLEVHFLEAVERVGRSAPRSPGWAFARKN